MDGIYKLCFVRLLFAALLFAGATEASNTGAESESLMYDIDQGFFRKGEGGLH